MNAHMACGYLSNLLKEPPQKFLHVYANPHQLRMMAMFLNRVAAAIEGKTIGAFDESDEAR